MIRSDAVRCARVAVCLLCDVSVAALAGLADTVARVAAAVRHNLAPTAADARQNPLSPASAAEMFAAGMPAALAHAMGLSSPRAATEQQAAEHVPEPGPDDAGSEPAPVWVPMRAGELTAGAVARINDRDYAVVTVRHEEEETCHDGTVPVVYLHLRDLGTGWEGLLPTAPTLGVLGQPYMPDDLSAIAPGTDDTGAA